MNEKTCRAISRMTKDIVRNTKDKKVNQRSTRKHLKLMLSKVRRKGTPIDIQAMYADIRGYSKSTTYTSPTLF
jgi:hypothetical protein